MSPRWSLSSTITQYILSISLVRTRALRRLSTAKPFKDASAKQRQGQRWLRYLTAQDLFFPSEHWLKENASYTWWILEPAMLSMLILVCSFLPPALPCQLLVGGFNPPAKYQSTGVIFPKVRGEHINSLKPSPRKDTKQINFQVYVRCSAASAAVT